MKSKNRCHVRGGGGKDASVWTSADHAAQNARKRRRSGAEPSAKEVRQAALSHDTEEKRDEAKLRLNLKRVQRQVEQLRDRLKNWDANQEAQKKSVRDPTLLDGGDHDVRPAKKRKGRKGPESWKVRGAARPAAQVYDFDVRFVDPHAAQAEQFQQRAQRRQNLLALHRGKMSEAPDKACHDYLTLLMQLGHLSAACQQYKSARQAWLEVLELEGTTNAPDNSNGSNLALTTAREHLMKLYFDREMHKDAVELGAQLLSDETVWVRYSHAFAQMRLGESDDAADVLVLAVRANPLCAYYLAYHDIFTKVFEYTDDLFDADDEPESKLEEAIEYAVQQGAAWQECGYDKQLRMLLEQVAQGIQQGCVPEDVDWAAMLERLEQRAPGRQQSSDEANRQGIDLGMYIGMFRTAMDMVSSSSR